MKSPLSVGKIFTMIVVVSLMAALLPSQPAYAQSNSITVKASADAHVDQSQASTNFGDKTYLTLDGSPVVKSYLTFNVSGLNGATISAAHIRLYSLYAGSQMSVSQADGGFSESEINFNNAPGNGSAFRTISSFNANTWLDTDVTHIVNGEGEYTFAITTSGDAFSLASRERTGSYGPQLVLTLSQPAAPTSTPTKAPTAAPTATKAPTNAPTATKAPTNAPTATKAPTNAPTATKTSTPAQSGSWVFCANENEFCGFSGTYQVRYGAKDKYVYKTFTNGTACTNAVFGDPIYGTAKTCSYLSSGGSSTAAPTSAPTQGPTATRTPTRAPTATQSGSGVQPYGVSGNWNLKFSDDFNGSSLDLNKWEPNWLAGNDTAITKPINGQELSCYDPAQVSVANGSLKLSAVARSCKANNGVTYNYASGIVTSRPHYTFNYGYMEARVWLDGSSTIKNWPAFWADGTGTWPTTGEIDVFEGLNGRPSWHYHYGTSSNPQQVGGYPKLSTPTGWHVFGADWEPGSIKFYYDGALVGTITSNVVNSNMFLILNYGVSTAISPPAQVPSNFLVDYVRVWQK